MQIGLRLSAAVDPTGGCDADAVGEADRVVPWKWRKDAGSVETFSCRVPTNEFADQLIPQRLKGLSVPDLLPKWGGIDFRNLLRRLGCPDLDDSNAVKLSHGFDKATLTAWMRADIDIPFSEPATLLEFGPVEIVIDDARFTASARMSVGKSGSEKSMEGKIFGDWRVACAGQTILTFRQTGLFFDHTGKIDFRIQPDRVELAEVLQFITELVEASGKEGEIAIEPLGRLAYQELISSAQYDAGRRFAELYQRHHLTLGMPVPHPRSLAGLMTTAGIVGGSSGRAGSARTWSGSARASSIS